MQHNQSRTLPGSVLLKTANQRRGFLRVVAFHDGPSKLGTHIGCRRCLVIFERSQHILINLNLLGMQLRFLGRTSNQNTPKAPSQVFDATLSKVRRLLRKGSWWNVSDERDVVESSLRCDRDVNVVRNRILYFDEVHAALM